MGKSDKLKDVVVKGGFSTKPQPPTNKAKDAKDRALAITETKAFKEALQNLNPTEQVTNVHGDTSKLNSDNRTYTNVKALTYKPSEPIVDLGFLWPITHGIPEDKTGLFMYHLCEDGIYCSKNVLGDKYITYKVEKMAGLPKGKEDKNILESKIPFFLLNKAIEFFKYLITTEKKDLEAFVLYGFNKETKKHFMWIPEQEVAAAAVSYDIGQFNELFPNCTIIADIHSHANMSAFFSGRYTCPFSK